ncbi:hypothetical protein LTS18_007071 [Coniosporium uncinatum]|uniref:Uncharacterized protein n=1 Tax=Coniosporium uncinatum TaxID=93489 RepID=A0ACC3DX57_9PEZI|nr:hypothetical protein LTS18_007071 [Coniosporium uncinatum]
MSLVFPLFRPARCAPVARITRNDFAPLFSLFDDTFNGIARAQRQIRRPFVPRFNVTEAKDSYSLEGELPGIDQKDISIEFTDENTLTIKGRTEKQTESGSRPVAEAAQEASADTTSPSGTPTETSSVKSHQPTVEDERPASEGEWTEVATPAASEAGPSTAAPEPSKAVAAPAPAMTTQQQQQQQQQPQHRTWVSERTVGEFSRSFAFPSRVNQDAVKASLQNGILSIVVPKAVRPENRRITIQ